MILGICGKSGSGKDTLINKINRNITSYKMIKATDRPIRVNEHDGKDYWYFNKEGFKEAEKFGSFITTQSFKVANGEIWDYGIFKNDFEECLESDCLCLITLTPYEVETLYKKLSKEELNKLHIVYLDVSNDIRIERLINRGDNYTEINRRIDADNEDFSNPVFLSMIDKKVKNEYMDEGFYEILPYIRQIFIY